MNITKIIHKFTLPIVGMQCSLFICTNVFAEDACLHLDKNATWNEGLATLSEQMKQNQWSEALKTADTLNGICDRSPILNFAMGRIYREQGNDARSLYFMQRATRYTEEFAVKGDTLEQMWFARYEAEHPEARPEAIEARKKDIEAREKDIEARDSQIEMLKNKLKENELIGKMDVQYSNQTERSHYAAGMWTGVGVGGLGVVMTAVGAGLFYNNKNKSIEYNSIIINDDEPKAKVRDNQYIYMGLIWAGTAMTITGAVVAGIFGYHYSNALSQTETVTMNLSPNGIDFSLAF